MMTTDQIDDALQVIDDLAGEFARADTRSADEDEQRLRATKAMHRAAKMLRAARLLIETAPYQGDLPHYEPADDANAGYDP